MPRPTDIPRALAAPLLAASMIPGPPPVITAYPARASPAVIRVARSYCGVPAWAREEPNTDTALPSSASRPNPSTNSAWIRSTRHGSVCTQSLGPRRSSRRWSVVVLGIARPRSMAGPWRRTLRRDSGSTLMILPSAADPVVTEDLVQREPVVLGPLGQPPEHEHARHAEVATGEAADPAAADADRPRGRLAPGEFRAGRNVDHVRGRGQHGARTELGAGPHPGAVDHHGPGADERLVLDHHGHRAGRLQHAADAGPAGEVDVPADLGAGPDGGPGVHHGARLDAGTDVDERGHEHHPGREVAAPAGDRAGHHPDPVQPGLQRHPVVVAKVPGPRPLHRQQPERQHDRLLGPFVHADLAGHRVRPGNPRLARVEGVHGSGHDRAGIGVVAAHFGPPGPQVVKARVELGISHLRSLNHRVPSGGVPRKRPTRRLAPVVLLAVVALAAGGVYLAVRHVPAILGETGCTAGRGHAAVALDPQQAQIAATIAGVAYHRGMPSRAVTVAYATAMQETHLHDPSFGDRDSVGVFQQRPSQGWGPASKLVNPVYASTRFFQALAQVHGYQRMPVYKAAQAVQHSADGYAYHQYQTLAARLTPAFTGAAPRGVWCWPAAAAHGTAQLTPARRAVVRAFGPLAARRAAAPNGDAPSLSVQVPRPSLGWAVAAWLVTHAGQFRLHQVRYAGFRWPAPAGHTGWAKDTGAAAAGTVQAS